MMTNKELKKFEIELFERGLPGNIREEIRKAKICIIDDKVDDLKSMHDSLKKEGFGNLQKFKKSPPIHDILKEKYDLIILDLNDVATEITEDDGIGILRLLKDREPNLPILVITGQKLSPDDHPVISRADVIRKKPIKTADLANEVETILKVLKDKFWGSIIILKELNSIERELSHELSFISKAKLNMLRRKLEKRLLNNENNVLDSIEKILKIVKHTGTIVTKILYVANSLGAQ